MSIIIKSLFKPQMISDIKSGKMNDEALGVYLLQNFHLSEVIAGLASYLIDDIKGDNKPISITQEQFNRYFRITGVKADGSQETRGRKPKYPSTPID